MMRTAWPTILTSMLLTPLLAAGEDLDSLMGKSELKANVQNYSERVVLKESTAAEQARARAKSRSEFGMELRPKVTNSEVGVALRMYLPDQWNKEKLQEQLILLAESEQLRVAALEWNDLMEAYRSFCSYRMYVKQLDAFNNELSRLKPFLKKANEGVDQNHLSVMDRAKLFSFYLDLVNNHEKVKDNLLDTKQELRLLLGADVNLEKMADIAMIAMPPEQEFNALAQRALNNRSDYRQFDLEYRSLLAAEEIAASEDGFRLKYIQPFYEVDYDNGENTVGLTASFILPWGTRNPDLAVFQQERILTQSTMALQRTIIEHRIRVLMKTANSYYDQVDERSSRIKPLLTQLGKDMETMNTGRLEDIRDLMLVRERVLDVSLQTIRSIYRKELIAVELAEELGSLAPSL